MMQFGAAALTDVALRLWLSDFLPAAYRKVMEPCARKYRVARVEGFHHYPFTQDAIRTVGALWLRFIDSAHFD